MITNNIQILASDIIDEILLSEEPLTPQNLAKWLQKYPQFKQEIMNFAVFEAVVETVSETEGITMSLEAEVISRNNIRNIVQQSLEQNTFQVADEKISSFSDEAEKRGIKFPQLAQKLGISIPLLANLEQRFITYGSIPEEIINKIANVLETKVQTIKEYLQLPPLMTTQASFKSLEKPKLPEKKDFFVLVAEDAMLSSTQKQNLMKLKK